VDEQELVYQDFFHEAHYMDNTFTDPALWHRIHFGFTITYHYLFPQLTMDLPGSWSIGNGALFGPEKKNTTEQRGSGPKFLDSTLR
jgi:hypothetical protein